MPKVKIKIDALESPDARRASILAQCDAAIASYAGKEDLVEYEKIVKFREMVVAQNS
jgi:hypothetical protein